MRIMRRQRYAIAIFMVGALLSALAAYLVRDHNQQLIKEVVTERANPLFDHIAERFNLYIYGLQEARTAVLAGGGRNVSLDDFRRFGATVDLYESFPGSRGFGFVRRVPAADVASFFAKIRATERPDIELLTFGENTEERFILQYLEPYQVSTNYNAIGLDIASEPKRRKTAMLAMLTGEARLSAPLELKLDASGANNSFLMLMPVYDQGITPKTRLEREASCFGWLIAPLELRTVLSDLTPNPELLRLSITDITSGEQAVPFFSNSDIYGSYPLARTVNLLGRQWRFHLSVTQQFIEQQHLLSPTFSVLIGLVISVLASASVNLFLGQIQGRNRLTQEQTKLHAIVESSADAIIGKTIDGEVMSWNSGAEKIFGYTAAEAIGKRLKELIIPEHLLAEEDQILARICRGENVEIQESVRLHKDGHQIPVSSTISPIFAANGSVVGAAKTVRDISRQKASEARIRDLNSNLECQVAQRTAELADINLLFETALTAATEFGIIATDTQGVIQLFNRGAERMLGYRAEDLIGKETPAQFHVPEEVAARAIALSAEFGEPITGFDVFVYKSRTLSGEAEYQEWTYIAKDGHRFPIRLVVNTMRDQHNQIVGYLGVASDLTEEKAAEAALDIAQNKLLTTTQTLLTASRTAGLGIWYIEYSDYSVSWNDKMYELYQQDVAEGDMTFERWVSILHPEDADQALSIVDNAAEEGVEYTATFRIVWPDGTIRFIHGAATIECDDHGLPLRMIGINIDITEDRQLKQSLIEAKEYADAASEAKSMFLANMSHEIRTPMNAVLGMLQLLLKTPLQTKQRDFASKARIAATSLLSLLNDILDYSKIESGKLELDNHPFNFNELMQHLAVVMTGNLRDKSIELLFDLDEQLPNHLIGDQLRLQQVLMNLLSNAIKFTEQGEVVVTVRLVSQQDDQATIDIRVKDSGIGISPAQQQRIFEGFTQAEASITRRFGGTGLGLVICRNLVALMGGELMLDSALNEGSCFSFRLTLPVNPQIDWQPLTIASQPKVLVVDDNAVARRIATEALARLNAKVEAVADAEQALHQLKQAAFNSELFDCVILDLVMPGMDGIALANAICEQLTAAQRPKMILLSAANQEELPTPSASSEFDLVLSKPITLCQLAQAVTDVLAGVITADELVITERGGETLKDMRVLLVEDNSFNQAVATELLEGEGAIVTLAVDGQQGVELLQQQHTPFDVVLMDIQMPKMDGYTATRLIRQQQCFAQLPIVAMTANVSQQDKDACHAAGMNAHLAKPLDFREVVDTLLQLTQHLTMSPRGKGALNTVSASVSGSPSLENILQRFGGNKALYRKLLVEFNQSFVTLLQALASAIDDEQWAQVPTILHTMKGSSGTAGFNALYDAVRDKEQACKQAQKAQLPQLLNSVVADFTELMQQEYHEIERQLGAVEAPTPMMPSAPEMTVACLCAELGECLQNGNMKAIDLAEQLVIQVDGSQQLVAKQVLAFAENLQFDLAIQQLNKLWSMNETQ